MRGLINPTLYTLASNATTYASAFHDITSGSNACTSGTTICGTGVQTTSYAAGTGYDMASGLGTIDLYNLMQAWPNSVPLTGSSTTVSAATLTPGQGASDTITFKVASASSSVTTTPTGTISLSIDGTFVQSLTLSGGTATYSYSATALGAHVISGVYTGDSVFSTSTGTTTVTVISSNSTTTLSAATTPAVAGTADTITITVTGSSSAVLPAGSVNLTVDGALVSCSLGGCPTLTPGTTNSTATYSFVPTTLGTHTIAASYVPITGSIYQQSGGTLSLLAKSPGTFAIAAPALTVTHGNTTTETVTVTPTGGYFGVDQYHADSGDDRERMLLADEPDLDGGGGGAGDGDDQHELNELHVAEPLQEWLREAGGE